MEELHDHNDADRMSAHDQETRPCGCPVEYHLADCPHLTGGYGPATKGEVLDLYGHLHPDDWPDSHD